MSETKRVAEERISWEGLQQLMDEDTILSVQIKGVVNAGVITYVQGVRAFIPASQLSTSYVEDLNEWLNLRDDAADIYVLGYVHSQHILYSFDYHQHSS